MNREGWICPKCGRGISPDEKTCDHGMAPVFGTPITFPAPGYVSPSYLPIGDDPTLTRVKPILTGNPYTGPYVTVCDGDSGDPPNYLPHNSGSVQ